MKYNKYNEQVADDSPDAVSDTPLENPEVREAQPAAPVDNSAEIMRAYQAQLLEANQRARAAQEEAERLRQEKNNQPAHVPTPEEERKFFDTPKATVAEIVRKEVADAIAPLNAFTRNAGRVQAYNDLKDQMRKNVAGFPYLTQIEHLIDQAMSNAPTIDANSIVAAYNQALGYYISTGGNLLNTSQGAPVNNTPKPAVAPLPPHARVTPPIPAPGGGGNGKVKLRELNENEKKIARYNKMDDKTYVFYTDHLRPEEVGKITDEEVAKRIKELFG